MIRLRASCFVTPGACRSRPSEYRCKRIVTGGFCAILRSMIRTRALSDRPPAPLPRPTRPRAGARPGEDRRQVQMEPRGPLSLGRRLARGEGPAAAGDREGRGAQGDARHVPGPPGGRARRGEPRRQGVPEGLPLRQPDRRPGHPRQQVPGHAPGDAAARREVRRGSRLRRAGDPEDRQGDAGQVGRAGAAAQDLPALPRRHPAARAAHAERRRRAAPRRRLGRGRHRLVGLQHLLERGLSVPDGDAQRRQVGQARLLGVQPLSRRAGPRRIARR